MKLSDFSLGDKLLLVHANKHGLTILAAEVFDINYKGNGLITYTGRYGSKWPISGTGAFDPEKYDTEGRVKSQRFGIVRIVIVNF